MPLDIGNHILDDAGQFRRPEGEAADPVVRDHVDEVAPAEQQRELPEVDLGDQHLLVGGEHVAQVGGEGRQVPQVRLGDRAPASRTRRTAAPIEPKVEPQPSTSTLARPPGSSTSSGPMSRAMPSILAWRSRTILSWLSGS